MFMVKNEYANAKKLLNVKLKMTAKNFKWFFISPAILFLGSIVPTIIRIMENNSSGVEFYNVTDNSLTFFWGMAVAFLVLMFMYRRINNTLSVFPQTNTGRFVSTQLFNHILAIVFGLATLAMYLLYYGVLKLISVFKDNIYFALKFNIGFIITGFLTYLAYSFLIIAVLGLVGAILRKWTYYAAVAFTSVISVMIINVRTVIEFTPKALGFLVSEPSPVLFMVKAAGLWIVVTALSLVLNYYTVYYKSQNMVRTRTVAVICAVIAVAVTLIVPLILLYNATPANNSGFALREMETQSFDDYLSGFSEIRIDVSHLPEGSKIKLQSENIRFPELDSSPVTYNSGMARNTYGYGTEVLDSLQGDALVIFYNFAEYRINGYDINQYANQNLNAYLDGDTLYIEYTFENAHVIFLPIWGIASQFDCYNDAGVTQKNIFGYTQSSNGNTQIYIQSESCTG